VILLTIYLLLLKCGDVHPNPGPQTLSLCHLNVQSLLSGVDRSIHIASQASKLDDIFDNLVVKHQYDIISLTETWLTPYVDSNDITLQGYQLPFRSDRTSRGGGSMVYVNSDIPAIRCPELEMGPCECTWLKLTANEKNIYFGVYYRPPGQNTSEQDEFLGSFQASLDMLYQRNPYAIICTGDFNDRCSTWENSHTNSELGDKLRNLVCENNMLQLVSEPTRITELNSSILDLIITDSPGLFQSWGVDSSLSISDHILIHGTLNVTPLNTQCRSKFVWHYNRADYVSIMSELDSIDWERAFYELGDLDKSTDFLINNIKASAYRHIPYRKINIKTKDKPWMTSYIKHIIRLRDRSSKTYNKKPSAQNRLIRNEYRKLVKEEIKMAKTNHHNRQAKMLEDSVTNPKRYWSLVKSLLGQKAIMGIPTLTEGGNSYQTDLEKAEHLNNYFSKQSTLDDMPNTDSLPNFEYLTSTRIMDISVTEEQTLKVLQSLNVNKACGPDGIGNKLLKNISLSIARPLSLLFNNSLTEGKFPTQWKFANVTAIFKKSDSSDVRNYRPVSLLSCLGKVFERVVYNKLYNYLDGHKLLTERNSGFKKSDGTTNQLVHMLNYIYSEIDKRRDVAVIFLDISKAFDKVYHAGLLFKLKQLGIEGNLLKWLESYLSNRKQRVVINGTSSEWQETNAGVPQGSILGPLLFLVFINDIVINVQSLINLFADDTSLMKSIINPIECFGVLQQDLNALSLWARQWLVTFNAAKTVYMLFSLKKQAPKYPTLLLDGIEVSLVTEHTHLGITLNSKLTWHSHIHRITTKANKVVNMLKRIRHLVPRSSAECAYRTLVLPIIEYGNVIYDNLTNDLSSKLEQVQKAAGLMCTGAYRKTSYEKLLVELGWETLKIRQKYQRLILMYKVQHDLTPQYLLDIMPSSHRQSSSYTLRNSSNISLPHCRTERYKMSFVPHTISDWNALSTCTRNLPSLYTFKKQLRTVLFANKANKLFQFGPQKVNKHHTWLRLGLSPLKDHLHNHHIVENNLCTFCSQEPETTSHFFCTCPTFKTQRKQLLYSLAGILGNGVHQYTNTLLTRLLLYGSEHLSYEKNTYVFTIVQTYIQTSKRFSFVN
jgi:hypothetical protein